MALINKLREMGGMLRRFTGSDKLYTIREMINEYYTLLNSITNGKERFNHMFWDCYSIKTFPMLDTKGGDNFRGMYCGCQAGTSFPAIDTSNGLLFDEMYHNCLEAVSFPSLDTSKGTSFSEMHKDCRQMKQSPAYDLTNGEDFTDMYKDCRVATKIPIVTSSKGRVFTGMFNNCIALTEIGEMDLTNAEDVTDMYRNCSNLVSVYYKGTINTSISFKDCKSLSSPSFGRIVNALADLTGQEPKTLTIRSKYGKTHTYFTKAHKDMVAAKNWNLVYAD